MHRCVKENENNNGRFCLWQTIDKASHVESSRSTLPAEAHKFHHRGRSGRSQKSSWWRRTSRWSAHLKSLPHRRPLKRCIVIWKICKGIFHRNWKNIPESRPFKAGPHWFWTMQICAKKAQCLSRQFPPQNFHDVLIRDKPLLEYGCWNCIPAKLAWCHRTTQSPCPCPCPCPYPGRRKPHPSPRHAARSRSQVGFGKTRNPRNRFDGHSPRPNLNKSQNDHKYILELKCFM